LIRATRGAYAEEVTNVANGTPGRLLTVEEWASLPEDERGELVDGLLVEEEVPDWLHEEIVVWLVSILRAWIRPRGGRVGGSGAKYAISRYRGRMPDASVFFAERKPPARGVIRIPPDIAIEILSPTPRDARRDRREKTEDYATLGIPYYWLIDPQQRTFEILALVSGKYERAMHASGGTHSNIPGCEGLTLDLDDLWKTIDELEA
jgi:Uma2 family endonuclease